MDDIKLSQLVSSRLCHDLIAPVGAINSGLELLNEVEDKTEVMSLISQSAESVARRLNYFRTSLGYTGANNFNAMSDVEKFIKDFVTPHNIALVWNDGYVVKDTPAWGRLVTNVVLNLIDIAPYGGTLTITFNPPNSPENPATFVIAGDILSLRSELVETIEAKTPAEKVTPKTVQAYITNQFAKSLGMKLSIDQSNQGQVKITALPESPSKSMAV